jgi:hypothetical protein
VWARRHHHVDSAAGCANDCSVLVDGYDARLSGYSHETVGFKFDALAPLTDPKADAFVESIKRLKPYEEPTAPKVKPTITLHWSPLCATATRPTYIDDDGIIRFGTRPAARKDVQRALRGCVARAYRTLISHHRESMNRHDILNDAMQEMGLYADAIVRNARKSSLSSGEIDAIQANIERITAALERYRIAALGN